MLSDHCPECLSVLSCPVCLPVTLVYCGQTVGLIKMKLGMQVGLGPGHIVLDGDSLPPPPPKGNRPQFSAHVCCGQMAALINMPLGMEVGLGPGDFVLDGDPAPPLPKRGQSPSAQLLAHFCCGQTVGCIKVPLGMEVGLGPGDFMFDGDPATLRKRAHPPPPNFWPMSVVAKRLDGSRCHLVRR